MASLDLKYSLMSLIIKQIPQKHMNKLSQKMPNTEWFCEFAVWLNNISRRETKEMFIVKDHNSIFALQCSPIYEILQSYR